MLPSYVTYRSRHTWDRDFEFIEIDSTVDAYKYSFFSSMIQLWSNLTEDIIICNNVDTFNDLNHIVNLCSFIL